MKPQSKIIISLLMIINICIGSQVNVLKAGNEKTVESAVRNEFTESSFNSLAPTTPREATFDDEVYSINESMFVDLKPTFPLLADFNDDSIESDLSADISSPDQPSNAVNTSDKKSPEMKQLRKIVRKLLISPGFTLTDNEDNSEIFVTFMFSNNGKLIVNEVTAPSKRLEEYVKKTLSDFTTTDLNLTNNQQYRVEIRFRNS